MEKKIVTLTREQFEIYRTCKVNPFYLANFVYIIHPVKGKVKFNLYEYQRAVLWNFLNNRFNIILKFRQAGLTELIAFFCLWLAMFNDNKNIRIYGSQGQQRTIALSLKLAELELVKNLINDTPVLLLDDVLSELDSERQNHLLNSIDDIQTIITCTGLDEFIENRFKINKVFQVTEGKVEEKTV